MDLSRFPRRRYTTHPTPLEPMPRFSQALAASCPGGQGPELWIKRDDMLGLFPGGNKTRKLEFLVADALAQGADTLITCGAPQSNHCRITLAAAVKEGLKCRFVIEERVPHSFHDDASGNHFMFRLMGVEAITVVPGGSNMAQAMQAEAELLMAQGRKGYIIPGGGSNAVGGLGYVACAQEMQQQFFDMGQRFEWLAWRFKLVDEKPESAQATDALGVGATRPSVPATVMPMLTPASTSMPASSRTSRIAVWKIEPFFVAMSPPCSSAASSGGSATTATAWAVRRVTALPPTFTIAGRFFASRWESSMAGGEWTRNRGPGRGSFSTGLLVVALREIEGDVRERHPPHLEPGEHGVEHRRGLEPVGPRLEMRGLAHGFARRGAGDGIRAGAHG